MSTKKTETEKEIAHPLEEIFDIEECTTVVPYTEVKTDLVPYEPYDEKDNELESQLQDLYDLALEAFENQQEEQETIDPKYKARNAEVAVQYLKTALEATREKRMMKEHKDKVDSKKETGPGTVNNNLIMSHSDMMKLIRERKAEDEALEGEYEDKTS